MENEMNINPNDVLELRNMLKKFPVGKEATGPETLRAKAGVVACLAKHQEQFTLTMASDSIEPEVRAYLAKMLALKEEQIPYGPMAILPLGATADVISDYSKIEFVNKKLTGYNETFDFIAKGMGLELNNERVRH